MSILKITIPFSTLNQVSEPAAPLVLSNRRGYLGYNVTKIYHRVIHHVIGMIGFLIVLRICVLLMFVQLFCVNQYHLMPRDHLFMSAIKILMFHIFTGLFKS